MKNDAILWNKGPSGGEVKIPVLGLCGEFESGKTLFAITIAPGVHPAGHKFAGKARTCVIDLEKSSENYAGSQLGFDRIDLPQRVMANPAKKAYTSSDLYEEFRKVALGIEDGRYDVLVVDPITDLDSGLADYIRDNPEKFGMTKAKIEKVFGLIWTTVKEEWNRLLLALSTKCKAFVFTAHMKDEYMGTTKTGRRVPRGKETLGKLATLYLELQRKPVNGVVPPVPTAIRLKGRLCDTLFNAETGEITTVELMPKVVENCTPKRLRELIAAPSSEDVPAYSEEHLSKDMRLAFRVELATRQAETKNATLELARERNGLLASMAAVKEIAESKPVQTIPAAAPANPVAAPKPLPASSAAVPPPPPPTASKPAPPPPVAEKSDPPFTPPESQTAPPASAPAKKSDNPMWDGMVEFPGPSIDRTAASEQIKTFRDTGYFGKDDLADALKLYKVGKVSELSEGAFESLFRHVTLVEKIVVEATKRSIPRSKLTEFAHQAKDVSFFTSRLETKQALLNLIQKQPLPSGN